MKTKLWIALMALGLCAGIANGQTMSPVPLPRGDPSTGQGPPAQAYEDCKGRKAGETVPHTTPEGKVAATCADSPKGLVARPNQTPTAPHAGGKR